MRKSYFVIMGMLAAGLILSGCEHNPRPKDASAEEKAAAELAEELGDGVEVDGTTVTVKSGETVDVKAGKPVTVDEGVTFMVPANSAVSVGSGAEFNVKGAVAVEDGGSFIVEESGTANVTGTVAVEGGGSFSVGNNGTANVEGTVEVKSGGNFTVEDHGTAAVSGQLTVGSGNTSSNNVNSYNANYQAAAGGNGISALEAEIGDGTLAVKSGGILEVSTGKITVNSGGILDVAGTINVANSGAIEVNGGGTLSFAAGNTGSDLKGTIYVRSGGMSKDLKSGGASVWKDADSTGKFVFYAGSKAYVGGTAATDILIGTTTDTTGALIRLESGTFSNTRTSYELDGVATAENKNVWVTEDMMLVLKAGSELKVNGTSTSDKTILAIVVTEARPGVTGEPASTADSKAAAKIVLNEWGFIDFYSTNYQYQSNTSSLSHNFYDNANAKITTNSLCNKTFTWDVSLGSNAGGWKAQASN